VQVADAETSGFALLPAPTETAAAASTPQPSTTSASCDATIAALAVNLRSGPGRGYSILGYGYLDQTFSVGGINPEGNWLLIGAGNASAWVARDGVSLNGNCAILTVFNLPLLDSAPVPINPFFGNGENEEGEHEQHEAGEFEFENEGGDD
jgi:uncharacterized protein YraI